MTLARYRAVLCDLDGCLVSGTTLLPGAAALVDAVRERLWIVSNNSTDTPATLAGRLAAQGLAIAPERLLLAGALAVETVAAEHPGARIALFAAAPLADHARALGLRPVDEGPQIVLLARDTGLTYDRLQRLVAHVHGGLPFFVANPDATHPDAQGRPVPETGALLQAVRSCVPDAAPRVIGKPDITLIETALRRAAARADEAVFIGDNPGTDGLGATRAGLDFIRVGPAGTPGTRRLADLLAVEAPDPALAARR